MFTISYAASGFLHFVVTSQPFQHLYGPLPRADEATHSGQRDRCLRGPPSLRPLQRPHQPHPVRLPQ